MNRRSLFMRVAACLASLALPIIPKSNEMDDEEDGLRLWFREFYVDLPKDRYIDSVEVDWAQAKEWTEGPWAGRFVAQCRVRPNSSMDWELFIMKRARC